MLDLVKAVMGKKLALMEESRSTGGSRFERSAVGKGGVKCEAGGLSGRWCPQVPLDIPNFYVDRNLPWGNCET